ncbi:MAG: hypothetical protein QM530_10370 [Phycisphaerales bacterium]|nr:hypothetical protein [Phycisphaerales bacterium]
MHNGLITSIFLFCFFANCANKETGIQLIKRSDVTDSFEIERLNNLYELGNLSLIDDSTMIGFPSNGSELSTYIRTPQGFTFKNKRNVSIKSSVFTFFIDNKKRANYIGTDKVWYRSNIEEDPKPVNKIMLRMDSLNESYRIFSAHNYPAIISDSTLILRVCEVSPIDYFKAFSEKSLCQLFFNKDSINEISYMFEKPRCLKEQYEIYPIYCKAYDKVYLIYPCIDSIYTYNLTTKKYSTFNINNPYYSLTEKYDHSKYNQPDYRTRVRLNNFRYTGFFFNPSTNHFIVYYFRPVDRRINIPTFEDQKINAIILDMNLKIIKSLEFENNYRSPGTYLLTKEGIAMPIFTKKYKNDKTIIYHIYNL